MPKSPAKPQPLSYSTILAFSFGFIFVSIILAITVFNPEPTQFQIFVYRVVLSLAAAGVGAVIPGLIDVNISNTVRAGGAIACFAIVFMINPPELIVKNSESSELDDLLRRAEAALANGNYHVARDLFSQAQGIDQQPWRSLHGLARAEYRIGNYASALDFFQQAYTNRTPHDPTLLFGAALSQEGMRNYDGAIKIWRQIKNSMTSDKEQYRDVVFSLGQIALILAQQEAYSEDYIKEAEENFRTFLALRGIPTHWANYHLACISSIKTKIEKDAERRRQLEVDTKSFLSTTIQQLKDFSGERVAHHREILIDLLQRNPGRKLLPGDPVPCPTLALFARQQYTDISKLFTA